MMGMMWVIPNCMSRTLPHSSVVMCRISGTSVQGSFANEFQTEFGFNSTVAQLLVSRTTIWFCIGPLFWGALSDKVGWDAAGRDP